MDSADCQEKSLPGMGIPRWMKKTTERYSYADICASPPSNEDGFLHISRHRLPPTNNNADGNAPCYQSQKKEMSPNSDSSISEMVSSTKRQFSDGLRFGQGSQIVLAKQDCVALNETSNFYKSVATAPPHSTLVNLAMASQTALPPASTKPPQVSENTAASEIQVQKAKDVNMPAKNAFKKPSSSLDSPVPAEDTKSTTVARRSGNPFFTGSQEKTGSGSWLFRSSSPVSSLNKSDKTDEFRNYSYEGREGRPASVGGSATASPQKGRLVPRPSELRELNFWSPTSM